MSFFSQSGGIDIFCAGAYNPAMVKLGETGEEPEKGEKRMQKFLRRLERFSQSLLSPLSYLSAAGLLLVDRKSVV